MTALKIYKTVAISDSEMVQHVLPTMFIKGEDYNVKRHPKYDDFVVVSGLFKNSLGGTERKEQSICIEEARKHLIYVHYK